MARLLDGKTSGDFVRLLIFMITTAVATSLLVVTIGNISFGGTDEYKAVFTDATGVLKGDDVRVAGVKVGTVKDVEVVQGDSSEDTNALVTFAVDKDTIVDAGTHATIRYRNLLGQRYISLTHEGGSGDLSDDTIPVSQTKPALGQ